MSTSKGPSSTEVFSAFETSLEWFIEQTECCPSQLFLFKRLRDYFFKCSISEPAAVPISSDNRGSTVYKLLNL